MDSVNPVLDRHDIRAEDKDSAAEAMAEQDLDRAASNYGDARYGEAREILERDRAFGEGAAAPGSRRPQVGEVNRARDFVERADANERATGTRFNSGDIRQLREEMGMGRRNFAEAGDFDKQAWRVGKRPGEALSPEERQTITTQIAGEGRAEEVAGGSPRRRVRSRWSREARGHALRGERLQARKQAAGERRRSQRGYRVSRGRDRRSVFRGF